MVGEDIHEDFNGHKGIIYEGGHMWMSAGKGIMHSEKPVVGEENFYWGLQLWINLPKRLKTSEPGYHIISDQDSPKAEKNGVKVKILAGESMGVKSSFQNVVPVWYLDFKLAPGAEHIQEVENVKEFFILF